MRGQPALLCCRLLPCCPAFQGWGCELVYEDEQEEAEQEGGSEPSASNGPVEAARRGGARPAAAAGAAAAAGKRRLEQIEAEIIKVRGKFLLCSVLYPIKEGTCTASASTPQHSCA